LKNVADNIAGKTIAPLAGLRVADAILVLNFREEFTAGRRRKCRRPMPPVIPAEELIEHDKIGRCTTSAPVRRSRPRPPSNF